MESFVEQCVRVFSWKNFSHLFTGIWENERWKATAALSDFALSCAKPLTEASLLPPFKTDSRVLKVLRLLLFFFSSITTTYAVRWLTLGLLKRHSSSRTAGKNRFSSFLRLYPNYWQFKRKKKLLLFSTCVGFVNVCPRSESQQRERGTHITSVFVGFLSHHYVRGYVTAYTKESARLSCKPAAPFHLRAVSQEKKKEIFLKKMCSPCVLCFRCRWRFGIVS